jgi:hypothetical protein
MNFVTPLPTFSALHDIRDKAILLSLGKDFLCNEAFLMKTGHSIGESIEHLKEDIQSLKMRFVGKFVEDVNTDEILDQLHSHAQLLQRPDKRVSDECTVGKLGADLEQILKTLTEAIGIIKGKVEGEVEDYTKKDAVVKGAKAAGSLVSYVVSLVIKFIMLLVVLAIGPAVYLGVTMDREGSLQEQLVESKARIQSQKTQIDLLRKERDELSGRIESSKGDNLSRQQRLEIIDLNVKVQGLEQKAQKAEAEIAEHERIIKVTQKKIEEIKSKPFLQRFLRQ